MFFVLRKPDVMKYWRKKVSGRSTIKSSSIMVSSRSSVAPDSRDANNIEQPIAMLCATGVVRILLFICNIVVWLLGFALFALGLFIFIDGEDYTELLEGVLFSASVVLLMTGFIIALIGFLGCYGAAKKNGCMLLLYGILLLIVILVQIAGIIMAFKFQEDAESRIKKGITKSLAAYGGKDFHDEAYSLAMDLAQENLECCGMDSNKDYSKRTLAVKWVEAGNITHLPDSCCVKKKLLCGWDQGFNHSANATFIHTKGCLPKLEDFATDNLQIVGIVAAAFVVVEICNLILAFWLFKQ